ncbi:murein biosynthesis integral membrane protein MurJ [Occultella aeris]|uniref:Putative peptidoglycan biosynthesis protein MviN n=1 Tax=Occultella aeris TaxID=2761496 RepID=A0A7M4DD44_9MICO|nr:murein biosynthesis integral membrane protein MurJ [Occultella aeris]VZO34752.1 putative peptidoglycan biosynthesis protein MviN [Occultella aeris]
MSEPRGGLAGSAALMFSGTLVSRILGLVRNALLVAAIFSAGGAADAFSVANKLPNIIYMLLAGGILNAVLVPQIVRAMRRKDGGQEYVNRLLTLAGAFLLLVTVVLTLASSLLVTLYAAQFQNGPWGALSVSFAFWCIPQLFFYGMYALLGQVLNARSVFGPYMWAPAANNVIAIAGLVTYLIVFGGFDEANPPPVEAWDAGRIALLAGSATLGVAVQALVLIIPLARSGFRFRPVWGLRNTGLATAGRVATWAFAALAAGQVGYLAVSNLAASAGVASDNDLGVAGNAAYDNAFLIFMLPQSLITVSLVTAMFTRLSEQAASADTRAVRDSLSFGLRTLAVFTVFAAAALMVLAIPVTQVIQFDTASFPAYRGVGGVLVAMLAGLPAIAIWTMAQRVYFAFEDTKSLFLIQVPMAVILIVGSVLSYFLLDVQWWVAGAGAATTVANTVGALVAYLALRRRLPSLDGSRVFLTHLRVFMAAVPAALIGWGLLHLWGVETGFAGALLRVLVLGALMLAIYLILLRRLRVGELDALMRRVSSMAAPATRPLAALATRVPIPAPLRTMWGKISGVPQRIGGAPVNRGTATDLVVGSTIADRYVLLARLTAPLAQSSYWTARDEILQRDVRIVTLGGPHREEALDAARRAALVGDERLARILRVGTSDGLGYLVTELSDTPSLADLVRSGPLPAAAARAIAGEAAGAVEAARKRGVHHLHLRPGSLLVGERGVVLTGLAVDAAQLGIDGGDARTAARTDSVDLVALLYTALTGTWPGEPARAGGLPLAPRHGGAPVPPGDVVEGIPHDLDTLCSVTFGPHEDGPYTPGELVRDLAPWDDLDPSVLAAARTADDGGPSVPPSAVGRGVAPQGAVPDRSSSAGAAGGAAVAGAAGAAAVGATAAAGAEAPVGPGSTARYATTGADAGQTDAGFPVPDADPGTVGPPDATTQLFPVRGPVDPSTWTLKPPPEPGRQRPFDDLVRVDEQTPDRTQIIDSYHARHEHAGTGAADPVSQESSLWQRLGAKGRALVGTVTGALAGAGAGAGARSAETGADAAGASGIAGATTPFDGGPAAIDGAPAIGAGPRPAPAAVQAGWDLPAEPGGGADVDGAQAGIDGAPLAPAIGAGPLPTPGAPLAGWDLPHEGADDALDGAPDADRSRSAVGAGAVAAVAGSQRAIGALKENARAVGERFRRPETDADAEPSEPRPRFNPTPIVILLMIALVILAGFLAFNSLNEARTSYAPTTDPTATVPSEGTDPAATTEPTQEPTTPPPPVVATFVSARSLDPASGVGDNEDTAGRAIDGNPETTWNSLRYNNPNYGIKDGLGFAVELEAPTLITTVTLDVHGSGGIVQIRNTDPSAPNGGEVLAEGPMGPNTTYTLSTPTELSSIVLWFPELPVAESDGRNRIELAEITVG